MNRNGVAKERDLERKVNEQNQANQLVEQYLQAHQVRLDDEVILEQERERHLEQLDVLEGEQESLRDQRGDLRHSQQDAETKIQTLQKQAPAWIAANDALDKLQQQTDAELSDSHAVMYQMQQVLEQDKQQSMAKERFASRREQLDSEIERLASPSGSNDPRLKGLADSLGGVLLSEIYDDITIDDAPYFSAMYGPKTSRDCGL